MATRSRIRKIIDFGRLRDAMAAPNADTRSWIALARVDNDPEAVTYEDGYGWVVDVTITSGQLMGEGPIPCRVLSAFGEDGAGTSCPIAIGSEVLVAITDGDANVQPVILGFLHNPTNSPNPSGFDQDHLEANIVARTTKGLDVIVANNAQIKFSGDEGQIAVEHEMKVDATDVTVTADNHAKLLGSDVTLAEDGATQSYVRGEDQRRALLDFVNVLTDTTVPPFTVVIAGTPTPVFPTPTLTAAATLLSGELLAALSDRIKGE